MLPVIAAYVFPLTFRVIFAFLIAFPRLSLRTIVYFLTLTDLLKVFFLAVSLGVAFLTVTLIDLVELV